MNLASMIWIWMYGVGKIWKSHFAFGNVTERWKLSRAHGWDTFSERNIRTRSRVDPEMFLLKIRVVLLRSGWMSIKDRKQFLCLLI